MSTGEVTKPRASSTTSKVAATGAGISIAAIIGLWSQVAPVIEQVKPIIHQFSPDSAKKIDALQDDIKKIDPLIKVITDKIKVIEDQVTPQPKPEPTPVDPSPDQQRIADMEAQIRKLLDEIAKKHEPPKPEPVPPQTTDLKIVDAAGKPITGDIASGQSVKVTASSAGDWKYIVTSGEGSGVSVFTYPDHVIVTLSGGAAVALSHASPTSHAMILVKCQDAPRPPPGPIPDDESNQTKPRKLFIAVVEDVRNRSPQTATTLSDLETWNAFRDKGHEWRFYDQSTQETRGLRAVQAAKTSTFDPPQIVIHDAAGTLVFTGPLPNMAGVSELIARLEAGK